MSILEDLRFENLVIQNVVSEQEKALVSYGVYIKALVLLGNHAELIA